MRSLRTLLVLAAMTTVTSAFADDSLCNPCVDGPEMFRHSSPAPAPGSVLPAPPAASGDEFNLGEDGPVKLRQLNSGLSVRTLTLVDTRSSLPAAEAASEAGADVPAVCARSPIADGPSIRLPGSDAQWFGTRELAVRLPDSAIRDGARLYWYGRELTPERAGELELSVKRLDSGSAAAVLRPTTNVNLGGQSLLSTEIGLPDAGCWEITGRFGDQRLDFVLESSGD